MLPHGSHFRMRCAYCGRDFLAPTTHFHRRRFCGNACRHRAKEVPMVDRFWAHVEKTASCWLWTGERHQPGPYGRLKSVREKHYAHRYSWELHHGPIPPGLHVCHHCDTPLCVRPDHLFLGTHAQNMADMARKRRCAFQQHPESGPRGERNVGAKLTTEQVLAIRASTEPRDALAQRYGMSKSGIKQIQLRYTWKHLPE